MTAVYALLGLGSYGAMVAVTMGYWTQTHGHYPWQDDSPWGFFATVYWPVYYPLRGAVWLAVAVFRAGEWLARPRTVIPTARTVTDNLNTESE